VAPAPLNRPSPSSRRESHPSKNPPRLQPYCVTAAVALLMFRSNSLDASTVRNPADRTGAPAHRSEPPRTPLTTPSVVELNRQARDRCLLHVAVVGA
jgi:hypothetical protein